LKCIEILTYTLLAVANECENGIATCDNDPLGIAECVDLDINYMCRCQHFVEYGFTWSIIMNQCEIKGSGKSLNEIKGSGKSSSESEGTGRSSNEIKENGKHLSQR
jgi:hypothetical protein